MISTIVGTIGGGFINLAIGYYTPLAIVGACIMSVGSGLLTTLQVDTSFGKWFGFQVIYGLGFGVCFQVPNLAAQTVLPQDDVPTGLALMMFGSLISAAIFVPIGQNVLGNQLVQRLSWITGFDPSLVTSGGVTSLLDALPENLRATGLYEYNEALRRVFLVSVVPNCLSVIGTAFLEWKSIKKDKEAKDTAEDTGSAEETKMGEAAQ
jgi:threonine/homoserine efflux transporter RhtA